MNNDETKRAWKKRYDGQIGAVCILVITPIMAFLAPFSHKGGMPPIVRDREFWIVVGAVEALGLMKLVWASRCPGCDGFILPLRSHLRCSRCKVDLDAEGGDGK